jgi:hypothetical protein
MPTVTRRATSVIMWVVGIGVMLLLMAMLLNLEIFPVPPAY